MTQSLPPGDELAPPLRDTAERNIAPFASRRAVNRRAIASFALVFVRPRALRLRTRVSVCHSVTDHPRYRPGSPESSPRNQPSSRVRWLRALPAPPSSGRSSIARRASNCAFNPRRALPAALANSSTSSRTNPRRSAPMTSTGGIRTRTKVAITPATSAATPSSMPRKIATAIAAASDRPAPTQRLVVADARFAAAASLRRWISVATASSTGAHCAAGSVPSTRNACAHTAGSGLAAGIASDGGAGFAAGGFAAVAFIGSLPGRRVD